MFEYEYVTRNEYLPVKKNLIKLIKCVQNEVRDNFTFSFGFIGSSKYNMITRQKNDNIGYDFDVNIKVNDDEEEYSAKDIKKILMLALNKNALKFGYGYCEDSTRVITIKTINYYFSKVIHSCDFCIVNNYLNNNKYEQEYIRFNKKKNIYEWVDQSKGYFIDEKIEEIKKLDSKYWNEVRKIYLQKKCNNTNPSKKSRSLFAETINEVYNKY